METINYKSFADDCIEELKVLQDQFTETFDIAYADWFYNQATGILLPNRRATELFF